MGGTYG